MQLAMSLYPPLTGCFAGPKQGTLVDLPHWRLPLRVGSIQKQIIVVLHRRPPRQLLKACSLPGQQAREAPFGLLEPEDYTATATPQNVVLNTVFIDMM